MLCAKMNIKKTLKILFKKIGAEWRRKLIWYENGDETEGGDNPLTNPLTTVIKFLFVLIIKN